MQFTTTTEIARKGSEDLIEDLEMSKNQKYLKQKYQNSIDSGISSLVI